MQCLPIARISTLLRYFIYIIHKVELTVCLPIYIPTLALRFNGFFSQNSLKSFFFIILQHLWLNKSFFLCYISPSLTILQSAVLYNFSWVPTQVFQRAFFLIALFTFFKSNCLILLRNKKQTLF